MHITFRRTTTLARLCATFALVHGLYNASFIFGLYGDDTIIIHNMSFAFFAGFVIARIIAAVGLWLLAPWGGVVLLFTLLSEFSIFVVASNLSMLSWGGVGVRVVELALLALVYRRAWITSAAIDTDEI